MIYGRFTPPLTEEFTQGGQPAVISCIIIQILLFDNFSFISAIIHRAGHTRVFNVKVKVKNNTTIVIQSIIYFKCILRDSTRFKETQRDSTATDKFRRKVKHETKEKHIYMNKLM